MLYILSRLTKNKKYKDGIRELPFIVSDSLPDLKKQYDAFIDKPYCYSAHISIPIVSTDYKTITEWHDGKSYISKSVDMYINGF